MATEDLKDGIPNSHHLRSPSTWMWAGIWSTAFTLIFMRTLYVDHCFVLVTGTRLVWIVRVFAWACLFVFFMLNNRGRLVLSLCLLAGYLLRPEVIAVPWAAAEASTISTLQRLARSLEAYKRSHPQVRLPPRSSRVPVSELPYPKVFQGRILHYAL